jgi:hypothetical protein
MAIDAEYIRQFAKENFVEPAKRRGEKQFSIAVKSVETGLRPQGLESGRTPLVCTSLSGNKFQRENGIVLDHWDGPPSGKSTTVVYHFRFADSPTPSKTAYETMEQRASRLTEALRGLMKEEIQKHGGTEAFLRWIRSDEDVK